MATTAQEVTPAFQGNKELLAQEDPQVSLENMEKKEIQCSFSVVLKVFRETEGTLDHPACQDLGVPKDPQAPWDILEHQGWQVSQAILAAPD